MPTIISHPAVALAAASWFPRVPKSLIILGAVLTVIPDLDVAAFALGIPYGHPLGHRGVTHSLLFAVCVAAVIAIVYRKATRDKLPYGAVFAFLFVALVSHGLLDALTNGGKGVGFFIPFSAERYFFPWRPIRVSPIGVAGFVERGWPVLVSELLWVWTPLLLIASARLVRARKHGRR